MLTNRIWTEGHLSLVSDRSLINADLIQRMQYDAQLYAPAIYVSMRLMGYLLGML